MPHASSSNIHLDPYMMPGDYDDQIAFLHHRIDDLQHMFDKFIRGHGEMKVFKRLNEPLNALANCHVVLRDILDKFCHAVKVLEPQVTETINHQPDSAPLTLSYQINGVSTVPSQIVHMTPNTSRVLDPNKPFDFTIKDQGGLDRTVIIKWRPTGPAPGAEAGGIPAGMKWEMKPGGHFAASQLSPMPAHPPTYTRYLSPKTADIIDWRGEVATASASPGPTIKIPAESIRAFTKKLKRSREVEENEDEGRPQHSRRARTAAPSDDGETAQQPPPLRRSARLNLGTKIKPDSSGKTNEKAMKGKRKGKATQTAK